MISRDWRGLIASDGKPGVGLLPVVWLAHLTTLLPPCLTGGHPRARRPVPTRERNRPASSTGATEAGRGPQAGPPRRPAPVPLEYPVGGLTWGFGCGRGVRPGDMLHKIAAGAVELDLRGDDEVRRDGPTARPPRRADIRSAGRAHDHRRH